MNPDILIITNSLSTGGSQKMAAYVANCLSDRGVKVSIMTLNHYGIVKWRLNKGIRVEHLELSYDKVGSNKRLLSPILERIKWMKIIRNRTKEINPNMVLVFNVDVIVTSRLALLGTKYGFIASDRLDPSSYNFIWKTLSNICYSLSDKLIFQTEGAMKCYNSNIQKKSNIIPNPYLEDEVQLPLITKRKKRIVAVGRLSKIKGFDTLIQSFKKVNSKFPEYTLTIYGDGEEKGNLLKLISKLDLESSVELPGFVKNTKESIFDASAFILSSRSEGMPNALIEAMGLGLPVVSTDCPPGGPNYLIQHRKNGLLVPVDDTDSLSAAIISVLSDKRYADNLGNEAEKIKNTLSEEKISEMWYEAVVKLR